LESTGGGLWKPETIYFALSPSGFQYFYSLPIRSPTTQQNPVSTVFATRLHTFLNRLPSSFPMGFEIRLLTSDDITITVGEFDRDT